MTKFRKIVGGAVLLFISLYHEPLFCPQMSMLSTSRATEGGRGSDVGKKAAATMQRLGKLLSESRFTVSQSGEMGRFRNNTSLILQAFKYPLYVEDSGGASWSIQDTPIEYVMLHDYSRFVSGETRPVPFPLPPTVLVPWENKTKNSKRKKLGVHLMHCPLPTPSETAPGSRDCRNSAKFLSGIVKYLRKAYLREFKKLRRELKGVKTPKSALRKIARFALFSYLLTNGFFKVNGSFVTSLVPLSGIARPPAEAVVGKDFYLPDYFASLPRGEVAYSDADRSFILRGAPGIYAAKRKGYSSHYFRVFYWGTGSIPVLAPELSFSLLGFFPVRFSEAIVGTKIATLTFTPRFYTKSRMSIRRQRLKRLFELTFYRPLLSLNPNTLIYGSPEEALGDARRVQSLFLDELSVEENFFGKYWKVLKRYHATATSIGRAMFTKSDPIKRLVRAIFFATGSVRLGSAEDSLESLFGETYYLPRFAGGIDIHQDSPTESDNVKDMLDYYVEQVGPMPGHYLTMALSLINAVMFPSGTTYAVASRQTRREKMAIRYFEFYVLATISLMQNLLWHYFASNGNVYAGTHTQILLILHALLTYLFVAPSLNIGTGPRISENLLMDLDEERLPAAQALITEIALKSSRGLQEQPLTPDLIKEKYLKPLLTGNGNAWVAQFHGRFIEILAKGLKSEKVITEVMKKVLRIYVKAAQKAL